MILTTSWDDGHPLDIRLLELLEKYSIKGTFYIPLCNPENEVMQTNLIQEISNYQEIGGHTVNHKFLDALNYKEAKYEIYQCKLLIENIISKQIDAFCFPGGRYSNRDIELILNAGFLFGRTTKLLSATNVNSYLMNTSIQVFNHSSITLSKHCIRHFNFHALISNFLFINSNRDFFELAISNFLKQIKPYDVLHIWGHSWEIDKFNLWNRLEDLFKYLSSYDRIICLNNTDTWNYLQNLN